MEDRDVVERQIGRRPRAFHRVAARCPFGAPAVTEQSPYDAEGAPFPTTYYLTCRHLVAGVSRLEAAGGVERWSAAVAASPRSDRRSRCRDGAAAARIRRELAGGSTRSRRRRVARLRDRRLSQPVAAQVPPRPRRVRARAAGLPRRRARPRRDPRAVSHRPLLLGSRGRRRMSSAVDSARRDWEDGNRRFELASRDAAAGRAAEPRSSTSISAELRRRVGGTFTVAMLADVYEGSDAWALPGDRGARADARAGRGRSRWSATPHSTSTRAELLTTPHERAQPPSPAAAPQPLAAACARRRARARDLRRSGSRSARR